MQKQARHGRTIARLATAICLILAASAPCQAQPGVTLGPGGPWSARPIYIPAAATAYSANTHAEANFLESMAVLRVGTALAREHHASAYRQELENYLRKVDTYFLARLKNREYRRQLHPPLTDRLAARNELTAKWVRELYQALVKDTPVDVMNWLLVEVYQQRLRDSAAAGRGVGLPERHAVPLSAYHLAGLWLSDRHPDKQERLEWRASDMTVLPTDWPYLLLAPEFDAVRRSFEAHRDVALEAVARNGELKRCHRDGLRTATKELQALFERRYQLRLRQRDFEPGDYAQANAFLKSLHLQVKRLLDTDARIVRTGQFQFDGAQLSELVDHMGYHGLWFSAPHPGDEGTYQYVFMNLREMYLRQLLDYPMPAVANRPPARTGVER